MYSIYGGSPDSLFVSLQQVQQIKADPDPLLRGDMLGSSLSYATNQVDTILLHLFVSILEDGGQSWQQILDGGLHLVHADHVDDSLQSSQNGTQHLRVLLTQTFVQNLTQSRQTSLLLTDSHAGAHFGNEICSLLPSPG